MIVCTRRGQKSNLHMYSYLEEKKIWTKNINFSWRKLIFKIWDRQFLENFPDKKIGKSKFYFFKLTFRRIFFSNFFSSKSQFKKWKFGFFDFLSGKFSKKFRSQILKINFRHENLIFFIQIFVHFKIWMCRFYFWPLRVQTITLVRLARA